MVIKVTQADIDSGIPRSGCTCPIALAVKRTHPDLTLIGVSPHSIASTCEIYVLPAVARNFIYDFDAERQVEPFTFSTLP